MTAPQSKSPFFVSVIGGLAWDIICIGNKIPAEGETFTATSYDELPGGKGANQAVALHRLSHNQPLRKDVPPKNAWVELEIPEVQVRMIGAVGAQDGKEEAEASHTDASTGDGRSLSNLQPDTFGQNMISALEGSFIDTSGVKAYKGMKSAVCSIWVEARSGQNRIFMYHGALEAPTKEDFHRVESFGSPPPNLVVTQGEMNRETVYAIVETAKRAGIDTVLNPAPARWLDDSVYAGLTHLILNETEALIMSGRELSELDELLERGNWDEITDEFLALGAEHVVVTLGEGGAYCSCSKGKGSLIPAIQLTRDQVIDATGAGDTFVGAYTAQWIKGKFTRNWDLESAVKYACSASAQTVQRKGARQSIPWADQLEITSASL